MVSKVLSKSGIKKAREKVTKVREKKVPEPMASEDLAQIYKQRPETNESLDDKLIKNEIVDSVSMVKKVQKTALDLEKIKRRTKLLRSDVDFLLEMIKVK